MKKKFGILPSLKTGVLHSLSLNLISCILFIYIHPFNFTITFHQPLTLFLLLLTCISFTNLTTSVFSILKTCPSDINLFFLIFCYRAHSNITSYILSGVFMGGRASGVLDPYPESKNIKFKN